MHTGAATVENSTEFLKKLNMELPFDPVIPLLRIYPKNPETPMRKNIDCFYIMPCFIWGVLIVVLPCFSVLFWREWEQELLPLEKLKYPEA